jgi:glyoxylase-like metal-dependent hydrolase (beta-lactamase superfamily II)
LSNVKKKVMETKNIQTDSRAMFNVAPGVWGRRHLFVNYYIVQNLDSSSWVLVDAGLRSSADQIKAMARSLYGAHAKPAAIVLTHGHFDHVGALSSLLEEWDVPVYAHTLEMPYLTGKSSYPPPDPTVNGGLMASLSFLFPSDPIDITDHIRALPLNGTIAELPGWRFLHTPGHSPGHVSLFREDDKVLIAGDAFVTTKAESLISTIFQKEEISGPPKYFTCNWASAKISVLKLVALQPEIVATGHGQVMRGETMRQDLEALSRNFDREALPKNGRYINDPAVTNENGVLSLPKKTESIPAALKIIGITGIGIALGLVVFNQVRKQIS